MNGKPLFRTEGNIQPFLSNKSKEALLQKKAAEAEIRKKALEAVFSANKDRLAPHAFGIALGLRYRGILTSDDIKDFRQILIKNAGESAVVVEALIKIISAHCFDCGTVCKVLEEIELKDVAEPLQMEHERLQLGTLPEAI